MRQAAMEVGVPSWARADHASDTRRSAALWADPSRATGAERGISSTAMELARTLDGAGGSGRIDWTIRSLYQRFRDEVARQRAYEAGRAAAEEAQRLEEEEGVVVPVVQAQQHPLFRGVADVIAAENRAARAAARERAARRVYTLDVRAVWLAGDLPADAPMAWRRTPYGGHAALVGGANRAGAPQHPEVAVARRALENRRDEASLHAGHHQVQSVSLARAMDGAVATGEGHSDLSKVRQRGSDLLNGAPPPLREPVSCGVSVQVPWLEQPVWLSMGSGPSVPADAESGLEAQEGEDEEMTAEGVGGGSSSGAGASAGHFAPGGDPVWGRVRLSLELLVSAVVPATEPGAEEAALERAEDPESISSGGREGQAASASAGEGAGTPGEQSVAFFDGGRAVGADGSEQQVVQEGDDDDEEEEDARPGRGMVLEASGVARGVVLEALVPRMGCTMRCPVPQEAFWAPLVRMLRSDAERRTSEREAAEGALRDAREQIAEARDARRAAREETEGEAARQLIGGPPEQEGVSKAAQDAARAAASAAAGHGGALEDTGDQEHGEEEEDG